jgi:membrane-bound serine protease (ClpP class)
MLQVLAEKNHRPVNVVRAMADPYVELDKVKDGFEHKKRSPLTLSAREAKALGVVDYVAKNRSDLLQQLGLQNAEVVEVKRTATEQLGAFLATPAIAGLLLVIGLLGIFVEVKTPGFGVPGVLGISALTLFFLGHIASGASDWGPMVVFFVGLVLIALEIFVIPGFGLVGIMGLLCVLVSFFWAFGFENISTALRVITLALTAAIAIMILLAVYVLPKTPIFRKVSLETVLSSEEGCKAQTADNSLIGMGGVALTPLRPSGVVRIGENRHDAASEGDFLESGEEVIVTACNGFQLIVRKKDV